MNNKTNKKNYKQYFKLDSEELEDYSKFLRRGSQFPIKKGKKSYNRSTKNKEIQKELDSLYEDTYFN